MGFLSRRLGFTRVEADEYYEQALSAYQKGKLEDAIEQIELALTLLPKNAEYIGVQGLLHLENDAPDTARQCFQKALNVHAGEAVANYGMGMLCFQEKKWPESLAWFNKVRTINPALPEASYYMALVYHRNKDNVTARVFMKQAAQLMEDAGDKRAKDARRWVETFERLIDQKEAVERERAAIPGEASGTRISRQEIEAGFAAGELGTGEDGESGDGTAD